MKRIDPAQIVTLITNLGVIGGILLPGVFGVRPIPGAALVRHRAAEIGSGNGQISES